MRTPQFQFLGFEPEAELQRNANRSLERLLDLSPYGSMAVALLERVGGRFRCAVDLYTRFGPFVAQSCQSDASTALTHVCLAIQAKLERCRQPRDRSPPQGAQASL
jgi:hypothetical protein